MSTTKGSVTKAKHILYRTIITCQPLIVRIIKSRMGKYRKPYDCKPERSNMIENKT